MQKKIRIGIIGAENTHTAGIAKTINVDKLIKGFSVDYVWGETEEYAIAAAKEGQIPNIVKNPTEMLGKIDALIVDHRHGKYHLKPAIPFVEKAIPCFIDKPFCFRSTQGKYFLRYAKKCGASITSFSVIPKQKTFISFKNKLQKNGDVLAGSMYGPADLKSKWGGIFFYGIHQVDAVLNAFGYNVKKVSITGNGNGSSGQMIYDDGKIITLNFVKKGYHGFSINAMCTKGFVQQTIINDQNPYLNGIRTFTKMFKTGIEPESYDNMLKPIQVLEAMEKSIKSGKVEVVGR